MLGLQDLVRAAAVYNTSGNIKKWSTRGELT